MLGMKKAYLKSSNPLTLKIKSALFTSELIWNYIEIWIEMIKWVKRHEENTYTERERGQAQICRDEKN